MLGGSLFKWEPHTEKKRKKKEIKKRVLFFVVGLIDRVCVFCYIKGLNP
jgi:hypothetical protein